MPKVGEPGLPINRIVCGDNVEVMKTLPKECIDLVVTSPPYDNLRTYGGHSWDFKGVAEQLTRVLKPGGVIVWVVADATVDGSETLTSMRQAIHFKDVCGLRVHDTMIWRKSSAAYVHPVRYASVWEFMFVFSKGQPQTTELIRDKPNKWAGTKQHGTTRDQNGKVFVKSQAKKGGVVAEFGQRDNVWSIYEEKTQNKSHPAVFPEQLAHDHIVSWSNEGDLVLDPFSGSGTTAKMAMLANRKYIGIEVNEEYCSIAEQRLAQAKP